MLDPQTIAYGTDNPEQLMDKFYQAGNEMLLTLRNFVVSPEKRKKPRTWGAIEAAKMVKVSDPTFRKLLESSDDIPGIVIEDTENGRKIKKYTLAAINRLRDKAGTRYKRPKGSKCLTIAISNLKGGVGKTETTVDLGEKNCYGRFKSSTFRFRCTMNSNFNQFRINTRFRITLRRYNNQCTNIKS